MDDLGPPVSPLALADGTPVYDRGGERIGVVDQVMIDEPTGIFEGLVIHTRPLPGRHVYAHHDQITDVHERGVVLGVELGELHEITDPRQRPTRSADVPEPRLEAILRRAWDRIHGIP